ncbi:MAG TPA: hypothetical protein PK228_08460 [Saprospiraceae bacterium]|nr:hypothetical protein [Saprospiraceae bacterium]
MTKTIVSGCLLAAFAMPLFAQKTDSLNLDYEFFKRQGVWDIAVGGRVNYYDFDEMNHILNQAGLPDVKPEAPGFLIGFRGSAPNSRWTGESSFEVLWSQSNDGQVINGAASLYRDFALNFRVMYDVSYGNRLTKLFPYAGFGFGFQALRTYKELPGGGNFVLTVAADVDKNKFNCISLPLEAGLSLEQGFKTRTYDIFIGLRGGYMYRALDSDWALDGDIIVDLPKPAAGAPFLAFTLRFKTDPQRAWEAYEKRMKSN